MVDEQVAKFLEGPGKRLLEESAASERAAKEEARAAALQKLPVIDREATAAAGPLQAELKRAAEAERLAKGAWLLAYNRLGAVRRRLSLARGKSGRAKEAALRSIRASVPKPIAEFVAKVEAEIVATAAISPTTEQRPTMKLWGRWHGNEVSEFFGNGESLVERARALGAAKQTALDLVTLDLPAAELSARLAALWSGLPAIRMTPTKGRPLSDPPLMPLGNRQPMEARLSIPAAAVIANTVHARGRRPSAPRL